MNNKLILILTGLFLAILLFFVTMFYFLWNDSPMDEGANHNTENIENINDHNLIEEVLENKTIDLKELLSESKKHARERRYNMAMKVIDEKIKGHDMSEYEDHEIIEDHYNDLLLLSQIETQYLNGFIDEAIYSIRNMNDPENFFLGFLSLDYDHKTSLTTSTISILPPPSSKIENLEISELTAENDVTKDVFVRDNKLESLFAMKITIDGDDLIAYVAKNNNGFYLYELAGNAKYMITVDKWLEIKRGEINNEQ